MTRMWWPFYLGACVTGSTPGLDTPTLPTPTGDSGSPVACTVPLDLAPTGAEVGPGELLQLQASGGTGAYRFELLQPALGAVHPAFGTYVAPTEGAGTDTVLLTDAGCVGEARAELVVGDGFFVLPERATVLPGTRFTFEATGRPGLRCGFVSSGSGGSITPDCTYEAGDVEGVDRVEVTDEAGLARVDVSITVDRDADLELWGHQQWALPLGSTFEPRSSGGSGVLDIQVLRGSLSVVEGGVHAREVGASQIRITDRFAGFVRELDVHVVAPIAPSSPFTGQRAFQGRALGPGDLDGDGRPDAIVASPELSGGAFYSGSVMVYAGGDDGLQAKPVWTTSGVHTYEFHGRAIEVADFDADGELDLAVGADGADFAGSSIGLVRIYRGVKGGFFEDEPSLLRGVYASDAAGGSLAACDYDGDGYLDLAVGAYRHEERTDDTSYATNTGAVLVFRGAEGGLASEPSLIRYGRRIDPATGAWTSVSDSRTGLWGMAGGDMDGDGDCELAVSTTEVGVYADESRRFGFVSVYEGLPSADGTLSAEPVRIVANLTDVNASLGRSVGLGDLDRDGRADLVVGAFGWDGGAASSGGVFAFLASAWDGRRPTTPYTLAEASWRAEGVRSADYLGLHLQVQDVDGDGYADVTSGAPRGEQTNGVAEGGQVRIWSGAGIDSGKHKVLVDVVGSERDGYFGQAAAPIGDLDGDGITDVVVYAGRSDTHGLDVGGVFFAPGNGGAPTELHMPGEASGHEHGRGLAMFDATGDGEPDLVVGSPNNAVLSGAQLYHGTTTVFDGLAGGGVATTGWAFGDGTPDQSSYDRRGYALSGDSDVDGDGYADLAVVSYADARPNSFSAAYDNPTECAGAIAAAGSVRIHRGGPSGVAAAPSFVFYGPDPTSLMRVVDSGFDFDGDGYDDVVAGGSDWWVDGGAAVLRGRPAGSGIHVMCDAERWAGVEVSGRFGSAVAAIGDVDGDGCDEVAVGAMFEDAGVTNQGLVRVMWGHGAACRSVDPTITTLGPGVRNTFAGWSLAGGGDVDGDGIPDLAVGGPGQRLLSSELGAAWVVPGAYLVTLPRQRVVAGLPAGESRVVHPLVPSTGTWGVTGPTPTGQFGSAVALVADATQPGRSALAVGIPQGDEGGVAFGGGVHVYRFVDGGLEAFPSVVVGGESQAPVGRLGETLATGTGRSVLLIGARLSSVVGLNQGAAYVVEMD